MDIHIMGKDRLLLLERWRRSPEYTKICATQKMECERLAQIAQLIYADIDDIEASAKRLTARTEAATESDIHRGVYCPSPILDIVIGNLSRGRILKRNPASGKAGYQFQFDREGSLLSAESLCANMPNVIEYIVHHEDRIYGLTVNPLYGPVFISEETFAAQKLIHYRYANLISEKNELQCLSLHSESYFYDDFGLKFSERLDYQAVMNSVDIWHYEFERKNGYLTTFKAIEKPFERNAEILSALPTYIVRVKRKA